MSGRTRKAVLNIASNFVIQILKTILAFATRTVFIYCLGKEALGLNGLFSNILSMLSLAELGVGTAINFSLYKPLANENHKKVSVLMNFYKKAYRIIGFIITILGIILLFFLKYLISDIESINNVYYIYILYLLNTVSTYFISYKETLINADQKNYKLLKIQIVFLVITNAMQILFLILTKSFIAFLIVQLIITLLQRTITNIYITKLYKNIDFNTKDKIEKNDLSVIQKNVKAMFYHKIGDYCINGTDNIIISKFISIQIVGLYSNYLTLLNLLSGFIMLFFNNLTSSLGNLVVTESNERKYEIYKKMDFIGFILYGFTSVMLINIFNDFISIWLGSDYCLDFIVVIFIVISFYLTGMRVASSTMKSAAGIYDIDKFTPLIQSGINLIVSIMLAQKIGVLGVILGTVISSIAIPSWQRPYIVYKHIFNKSSVEYFIGYIKNIAILTIITILSMILISLLPEINIILLFVLKSIIVSVIYLGIIIIFYKNTDEFKDLCEMSQRIILRRKCNEK